MVKKWAPMPENIRAALNERVNQRYRELMAELPKIGVPNPSISHELSADGYKAEVQFYDSKGGYSSSLWEYTNRDQRWHMYHDWKD